jgi:hypothetical protein
MKFRVSMKDPDTLQDTIDRAVAQEVKSLGIVDNDEAAAVAEVRREKVAAVCAQWFKYGEYLTVDIDTEAGTCVVVKS